jgi:hypothetical protein
MGYHFDGVSLGYVPGQKNESKWSLVEFKRIYSDWDAVYKKGMGNDLFGQSRNLEWYHVGEMTLLSSENIPQKC